MACFLLTDSVTRNPGPLRSLGEVNIEDFRLRPFLKASSVDSTRSHCATIPPVNGCLSRHGATISIGKDFSATKRV